MQLGLPAGAFTQTADFGASHVTLHSRPLTFWLQELVLALMLLLVLVPVPELMLVLVLVLIFESVLTFELVVLDAVAVSARPQAAQNRARKTIRTFIIGLLSQDGCNSCAAGREWLFGRALGASVYERIIEVAKAAPDVWIGTRSEAMRHFKKSVL